MSDHDFRIAELERRLDNVVRGGTIVEADYLSTPPVAKIKDGELVSGWIPFMATRAVGEEVTWSAPEIGERVMILTPGGDPKNARIIPGAMYCDANPAPAVNQDVTAVMHKDGAHDTYDRKAHVRTIQIPAGGELRILVGETILTMTNKQLQALVGGTILTMTNDAVTFTTPLMTLDAETHLGGSGGEPVARKGDAINHSTQKITEGSANVYSK